MTAGSFCYFSGHHFMLDFYSWKYRHDPELLESKLGKSDLMLQTKLLKLQAKNQKLLAKFQLRSNNLKIKKLSKGDISKPKIKSHLR